MINYLYYPIVIALAAIWLLVAIANRVARISLSEKISAILSGDWETVAKTKNALAHTKTEFYEALDASLRTLMQALQDWMRHQYLNISGGSDGSWKLLGYLFQIILLGCFLYSDAIVISNNLDAMGYPLAIPAFLTHYEIAIAFGSFFSVIAGALVANELYGRSEFSDWKEQVGFWKNIAGTLSLFLIFSGAFVIVATGLARFTFLANLPADTTAFYQRTVSVVVSVLVPVNIVMASMLIIREGIKGVLVLVLMVASIFLAITYLLFYLLRIITTLVMFLSDVVFRILIILLSLIGFYIFTPIDTVTSMFRK